MRKAFTILAALVLAFSFSFAQVSNNQMAKRVNKTTTTQEVNKSQANPQSIRTVDNLLLQSSNPKDMKIKQVHQNYRITGNPVWGQTMSYCLDPTPSLMEILTSLGTSITEV